LFEWDDANREHVEANGVAVEEVEDALLDSGRVGTGAYNVGRERRWAALGRTEAGRLLFVVFTRRGSNVRVITARDAAPRERRRYRARSK
jgi:uncharacterized DUF497 family protein